jgi:hypothetical protein
MKRSSAAAAATPATLLSTSASSSDVSASASCLTVTERAADACVCGNVKVACTTRRRQERGAAVERRHNQPLRSAVALHRSSALGSTAQAPELSCNKRACQTSVHEGCRAVRDACVIMCHLATRTTPSARVAAARALLRRCDATCVARVAAAVHGVTFYNVAPRACLQSSYLTWTAAAPTLHLEQARP